MLYLFLLLDSECIQLQSTFFSQQSTWQCVSKCGEFFHEESSLLVHLCEGQSGAQLSGKKTRDSQKSLGGGGTGGRDTHTWEKTGARIFNEWLSYLCVVRGRRGILRAQVVFPWDILAVIGEVDQDTPTGNWFALASRGAVSSSWGCVKLQCIKTLFPWRTTTTGCFC